jgi:hypothetical protein
MLGCLAFGSGNMTLGRGEILNLQNQFALNFTMFLVFIKKSKSYLGGRVEDSRHSFMEFAVLDIHPNFFSLDKAAKKIPCQLKLLAVSIP